MNLRPASSCPSGASGQVNDIDEIAIQPQSLDVRPYDTSTNHSCILKDMYCMHISDSQFTVALTHHDLRYLIGTGLIAYRCCCVEDRRTTRLDMLAQCRASGSSPLALHR